LPNLGPYGKTGPAAEGAAPSLQYEPDLEDEDRVQREDLRRRKRRLLQALVISVAVTGSSAAWAIDTRRPSGPVPAFIFVDAGDRPIPPPAPPPLADKPPTVIIDSAAKTLAMPAPSAFATRPTPAVAPPSPRRRDSSTQRVATLPPVRHGDSLARSDSASVTRAPPVVSPAPPPAPAPSPPPAPVPQPREEATDPAVDKARAADAISGLAGHVVSVIAAKSLSDLTGLMPADLGGDAGKRERFLNFVREFGPRPGLGAIEGVAVAGDRAEARFSIAFTWRGDFGVDRRKPGRFLGILQRQNGEWRPLGVRFLDGVP